jgi:hypothetical protein
MKYCNSLFRRVFLFKIYNFYGEEYCHLGCDAMQLVRNCPFWRNLLTPRYSSSSKQRQQVPLKWKISTRLHGMTSKKTLIVVTAIITSSMKSYILLVYFINKMFHINYTVMKDECD